MAERPADEMLAIQQRMLELFPAVRDELLRIPGVVSVGIGIKKTAGRLTGEPAWTVRVVRKKARTELAAGEIVPAEIAGFPTDVKIHRRTIPEADEGRYRPLRGGIQIGRAGSSRVGTLGCFGHLDTPEHEVILLTAAHVVGIRKNNTPAGLAGGNNHNIEVGQPVHKQTCCCTCCDIAVTVHGVRHLDLDFAIARLKEGVQRETMIEEIGPITGIGVATMGTTVKKRGRTTGLTTGTITDLLPHGAGVITKIIVQKNSGNDRFSRKGDSGSALLDSSDQIVGLHYGGFNTDNIQPPDFESHSQPIQRVIERLAAGSFPITISTGSSALVEPRAARETRSTAEIARTDMLWAVELRLRETGAGRHLWEILERHAAELLYLVENVRAVTLVWQRNQGPTFLAALGRSLKEPIYRIPREVNGVTREQFAAAMLTILDAHGSAPLRVALTEHRTLLRDIITNADTTEEMFHAWEEAATAAVRE